MTQQLTNTAADNMEIFTFGDPEPVLNSRLDYWLEDYAMDNGTYYESPLDLAGLAKLLDATPQHGPILARKKDLLLKWFKPSPYLSRKEFEYIALDFVVFGQLYVQRFVNGFGKTVRLAHQPRISMRKSSQKDDVFIKLRRGYTDQIEFKPGEIAELKEPDVRQKIYGKPTYIGGIQSVLLNADATLFRRRWYLNGAHMGFILVANDANLNTEAAAAIQKKLKESKGVGNGRNMFINIPRSQSREPIKVIPIGDIGSKDDIEKIKAMTKEDALAMHLMPPELAGIIPNNTGGFGDREKALKVYHETDIEVLQMKFMALNDELKLNVFQFEKPDWTL